LRPARRRQPRGIPLARSNVSAREATGEEATVKHVLYARFSREEDAVAALHELDALEETRGHYTVKTHHAPLTSDELGLTDTASRKWGTEGLLLGGAVGALMGGVLFPAIGIPIAAPAIAAAATGAAGCVYGGVLSTIVGATTPDRHLKAIAKHMQDGDVLLTIQAEGEACEEKAEQVLTERSAEVARHELV
jgi:hypothetical protein